MVGSERGIACNSTLGWCWAGRIPNHQFGFTYDLGNPRFVVFEAFQQSACRYFSHFFKRLAHGGESWVVVHSNSNVVEAHHRNIFRNPQSNLLKRADGADGGDVIIRKQGGMAAGGRAASWRTDNPTGVW